MPKSDAPKGWDDLSKAEQEVIKRDLLKKAKELHADAPKPKGKPTFTLKGYVRCELSASDKEAFKAWELATPSSEVMEQLIKETDSGYLLKVGEQGNAHQASLCAASTSKEWDGYVLTAHASSSMRAAALLVYKHAVLMERDWTAWQSEEGDDFFR